MKVKDMVEGEFYKYSHPKQTWGRPATAFLVSKEPHRKSSDYSNTPVKLREGADKRGSGVAVYFINDYNEDHKAFYATMRAIKNPADRITMLSMIPNEFPLTFAMTGGLTMTVDRAEELAREQEAERIRYEKERKALADKRAKEEAERIKKAKELDRELNDKLVQLGVPLKAKDAVIQVPARRLIELLEARP